MSKVQQTQIHVQKPAAKKAEQAPKPQRNAAHMLEAPETMRPEDMLAAQQQVGNQVVQRALDKNARRQSLTNQQGNLREDIANQIQKKRGGGSPLPENVQGEAARKLGRSFKDVRIHTDESADKLSRTIHARAFTIGKDIFFKGGVFAPGSSAGRETLIHELTHVIQQSGRSGSGGTLKLGAPDTAHEKEADRMGKKHAASVSAAPAGAVQREAEEDELQMQGEEEEELLQAQPAEEEELLQAQPAEEEELQMQPDAGGVIQRSTTEEEKKLRNKAKGEFEKSANKVDKKAKPVSLGGAIRKFDVTQELKNKPPTLKKTDLTERNKAESERVQATKDQYKKEQSHGPGPLAKSIKHKPARDKWMGTLKDPKASKEDISSAKEKLQEFHKGALEKKDFKAAKAERQKALEESAKSGDDKAYEKIKAEREDTFGGRAKKAWKEEVADPVKSFGKNLPGNLIKGAKSVGKGIFGLAKKGLTTGLSHYFGGKDKDEDEDEEKGKKKDKKGDSGIGTIMEKYAEVLQENKKLKEQLAAQK